MGARADPLGRLAARAATPATAAAIVARAAPPRRRASACSSTRTLDEVARDGRGDRPTHVQLHGDEGPAFCSEVARRTGCKVIKAARVAAAGDIRDLERFHTDFHLLDARRGRLARRHGRDVGLGACSPRAARRCR